MYPFECRASRKSTCITLKQKKRIEARAFGPCSRCKSERPAHAMRLKQKDGENQTEHAANHSNTRNNTTLQYLLVEKACSSQMCEYFSARRELVQYINEFFILKR